MKITHIFRVCINVFAWNLPARSGTFIGWGPLWVVKNFWPRIGRLIMWDSLQENLQLENKGPRSMINCYVRSTLPTWWLNWLGYVASAYSWWGFTSYNTQILQTHTENMLHNCTCVVFLAYLNTWLLGFYLEVHAHENFSLSHEWSSHGSGISIRISWALLIFVISSAGNSVYM